MRHVVLVVCIAVGLWGALALPAGAAITLPRTVAEQADWLAAFYAAGLEYHYGPYGLTPEAIQTATGDLARGLSQTLKAPLDARQLSELSGWLFRATSRVGALDLPPPPLEFKEDIGHLLHLTGLYLSRPRLTHEQQDQIAGQLGAVLDVFYSAMLKEFAEVPDGERWVRETVYAEAARFARRIGDPVPPFIKRPFTPEEIADLCAYARRLPVGEYQRTYLFSVTPPPRIAALGPVPISEEQAADAAKWTIHGVGWSLNSKVLGVQYTPPTILTPEEEAALSDYYRNTPGAHSEDPEAMAQRAEEGSW